MERKIGETFEFKGKTYKVVKFNGCANCAFKYDNCPNLTHAIGNCIDFQRSDGAKVMFEETKGNKLTIDIPEGMEIDLQNSNFDTGVIYFKKKQPEFKDGDIAFADYGNRQDIFIVSEKTMLSEGYSSFISLDLKGLTLSMGCRTFFFKEDLCKLRLATEEEKQQLFDALEKEGKAWDAEKKQIVDLKPKVELKPFDKVLVRDSQSDKWRVNLFGYIDKEEYYHCAFANWVYCIPYAGNEHLLGTTKDVEG